VPGEQILIVENDPIIGRMLEILLKTLGYVVTDIVATGPDALVYATTRHSDLVLIDTSVSGPLDGIETAHYLTWMFNIPVIFLSGDTSTKVIERAKQANPLGYLIKPVEKQQLFSTIEIGLNLLPSQKISREEHQLRDHVAGLLGGDDGIICLNKKEGVLLMNSAAEFITGTTTRSAFLSPVREILRFPDEIASSLFADSLVQASRGTPSAGKMKNFLVRSKDGSTKSVSLNVLPVRKADREIIGTLVQIVFTHSATMQKLKQQQAAM
jgi:two-component system, response regulator PdtaR